jgi:hypothetical protein
LKLKYEKDERCENLKDLEIELKQSQKLGFDIKKLKTEILEEKYQIQNISDKLLEKESKLS